MGDIKLLITNPATSRFEGINLDLFVFGTRPQYLVDQFDNNITFTDAIEKTNKMPGEYSLVGIQGDSDPTIHAYRGVTSSFDVFYTQHPNGTLVISDHFREAISDLPVENRSVPKTVVVDQLLFGTRPSDTYISEIGRLCHGERLYWSTGSDPDTEIISRLSKNRSISPDKAKQRLDSYLDEIIGKGNLDGPTTTMLSGGIDSTLVHSYLQTGDSVSASINSPRYDTEVNYAERASELLETDHKLVEFEESDFISLVEQAIDATGHPLLHLQTTLIERTFAETPFSTYYSGEFADALFGKPSAYGYKIASWTPRIVDFVPNIHKNVKKLKSFREDISVPATDTTGFAMNASVHADRDLVSKTLSPDDVIARQNKRLQYTSDRIHVSNDRGYNSHMHLGHFMTFFQGNTASLWRHAAHAHGKEMQTPFPGKEGVKIATGLDPSKRYVRRLKSKWLPKSLLKERLPKYDIDKPKQGSGVNVERYFKSGPLENAFDKYPVPEFVPMKPEDLIRDGNGHFLWYAFSYSVWRDRILENDDLERFDTTTVIKR